MTNDLKNFLEEEYRNMRTQSLVEHDDKLINFVLDLMEKEVEKESKKVPENRHPELGDAGKNCECAWCMLDSGKNTFAHSVSTIINNLRI